MTQKTSHLKSCEPCWQEYKAYQDIHSNRLPLLHSDRGAIQDPVLVDFAAIKTVAGRNLRRDQTPDSAKNPQEVHGTLSPKNVLLRFPQLAYGLCGILVLTLGVVAFENREQGREARMQIAALQERISHSTRPLQPSVIPRSSIAPVRVVKRQDDVSARSALRIRDLEHQLRASADETGKLRQQIQASNQSDVALTQRVTETEQQIQKLSTELETVSRDRDETSANLKARDTELQDQKVELQDKKAELLAGC